MVLFRRTSVAGLFVIWALLSPAVAHAQSASPGSPSGSGFSFGANMGVLTHLGDVKRYLYWPDSDEVRFGGSWFFDYHFSSWGSASLRFMSGNLHGYQKGRTHSFHSNLRELTVNGRIRLNHLLLSRAAFNEYFSLYGLLGVGFVHYDARSYLYDRINHEMSGYSLAMPVGVGAGIRLLTIPHMFSVDLLVEFSNRITGSDRIDAVESGEGNDVYNFFSIGLAINS